MADVTQIAAGTIDALKSQPLALALIVINVLFLIGAGWGITRIGATMQARDAMLLEVIKGCQGATHG